MTAFDIAEMPLTEAVRTLRTGVPAKSFEVVANVLGFSTDVLGTKLGIPPRTLRDQVAKKKNLSAENSEKLVRVARVHRLARTLFTTDEAAADWLRTPAPALDGVAPIDLLDTDIGGREVESVINGIAYGNVL